MHNIINRQVHDIAYDRLAIHHAIEAFMEFTIDFPRIVIFDVTTNCLGYLEDLFDE